MREEVNTAAPLVMPTLVLKKPNASLTSSSQNDLSRWRYNDTAALRSEAAEIRSNRYSSRSSFHFFPEGEH